MSSIELNKDTMIQAYRNTSFRMEERGASDYKYYSEMLEADLKLLGENSGKYRITLCNSDLECQELPQMSSKDDARETASRLEFFLPKTITVLLEQIEWSGDCRIITTLGIDT